MEMKQISETTLKIMITMEDLEEHGMELKDFLIPQEKQRNFSILSWMSWTCLITLKIVGC